MTPEVTRLRFPPIVDVEQVGEDEWSGIVHSGRQPHQAYGGSLLAHAVAAAHASVGPDRSLHSLHAYFLRPTHGNRPVFFTRAGGRDGASYSWRRFEAQQAGKIVLDMTASFKQPQPQAHRREPAPDSMLPGPDELPDGWSFRQVSNEVMKRIECREAEDSQVLGEDGRVRREGWFRIGEPLEDSPLAHLCGLAYLSDATLASVAAGRTDTPLDDGWVLASLDHAMWFHMPARADRWLRFVRHSPVERDGRGFVKGQLWNEEGDLVVSLAQEALVSGPTSSPQVDRSTKATNPRSRR